MLKSSAAQIVYTPRSDVESEAELDALANLYRFIAKCHAKRKAAEPTPEPSGRDGTTVQGDSANAILPH